MKKIERMIKHIKEEVHGGCNYAEKYVFYKETKPQWAKMYSEMAMQELSHAENLRSMGQEMIDGLTWVPEEDAKCWENCIAICAEKVALVRLMLSK